MDKNKILIIDDDESLSEGILKVLSRNGYLVETATTGSVGIEKMEEPFFDLVLLDINMPDLSGLEVLENIRSRHKKNLLPVIMISARDQEQDIVNALRSGANDYVTKPMNLEVLVSRVQTQLEIAHLSLEFAKKEQIFAIGATIATYNHEINNALAISMGHLEIWNRKKIISQEVFDKLYGTQVRIHDLVAKINEITENSEMSFSDYSKSSKMLKVDK